ncbi:MAG: hypothetical protein Q9170_003080 [Blastenia crenularia]
MPDATKKPPILIVRDTRTEEHFVGGQVVEHRHQTTERQYQIIDPSHPAKDKRRQAFEKGRREIERGRQAIQQGRREIKSGAKTVERGRQTVEKGRQTIKQGRQAIDHGRQAVEGRPKGTDPSIPHQIMDTHEGQAKSKGQKDSSKTVKDHHGSQRSGQAVSKKVSWVPGL